MKIPEGYEAVTSGSVRVGDKVWSPKYERFVDVDQVAMDLFYFLDALAAEEFVCLIRRTR